MHRHVRALEPRERFLEQALNGLPFRLALPANEARPVVGEGKLESAHVLTLMPGLQSKTRPTLRRAGPVLWSRREISAV